MRRGVGGTNNNAVSTNSLSCVRALASDVGGVSGVRVLRSNSCSRTASFVNRNEVCNASCTENNENHKEGTHHSDVNECDHSNNVSCSDNDSCSSKVSCTQNIRNDHNNGRNNENNGCSHHNNCSCNSTGRRVVRYTRRVVSVTRGRRREGTIRHFVRRVRRTWKMGGSGQGKDTEKR